MRLIFIDRSCANSPVCCRLTTPRSALPHTKTASFHLRRILAEDTLVRTRTRCRRFLTLWLGSQHRSPLQICPRLCFGTVLSHLAVVFLPILARTVPPAVSLRVSSHRFQLLPRKCLSTGCAAGRQQGCEAFLMTATNCFSKRSSRFLPTDPARE